MSCRFILLGIASFFVICSLHVSNAAILNRRSHDIAEGRSLRSAVESVFRQISDDPADEESNEDEDEYDAEQAQLEIQRHQQAQEESQEDSEEDDDDDMRRRRRRDVSTDETAVPVEAAVESVEDVEPVEHKKEDEKEDDKKEEEAIAAAGTSLPVKKPPSVLILIRDALKKVTSELPQPTQQVATSALQYFQLFEHFLQQTIEQVIGDDDDDEEEVTTVKAEVEAESVDNSENKKPDAVEAQAAAPVPLPAPVPAPAPVPLPATVPALVSAPAPSLVTLVEKVAEVIAEELKPEVVLQQIDVPKTEVVVSETVVSNKV